MPVAQFSSVDSFIHRDYTALFALVPTIAVGSIAGFLLRDRALAGRSDAAGGPAGELALAGVLLALMADRVEFDPLGYPRLAGAAARLVRPADGPEAALSGRARRAAVDVLRPLALSTLLRASDWGTAA